MTERSNALRARFPNLPLDEIRWTAHVAGRIGGATTLSELALSCEEILGHFTEVERHALYLLDFDTGLLRLFHASGFTEEERLAAEATALDRHPGWVLRNLQPLVVADTALEPPGSPSVDSPRSFILRSRMWLPIMADGEGFGAIGMFSVEANAFDDYDRGVLHFVAEIAAMSYQRLRAVHTMSQQRTRAIEAERRADRHHFAALLHTVPDAVVVMGADGRISYWNPSAALLLGYSEREAVGQPVTFIMPVRFRAPHLDGLARHLATGTTRAIGRPVEIVALHAQGHEIPIELMLSRVEEQDTVFFVGVLRDITERKRAEIENARAEEESRRFAAALLTLSRSSIEDLAAFQRGVTEVVARTLDVERVSLWLFGDDSIVCDDLFEQIPQRHSNGLVLAARDYPGYFLALHAEEAIVAAEAQTHPATREFTANYLAPLGIVSMLDVPLPSLSGLRGVVCVESTSPRAWRPSEVSLCREVATLVAQAIDLFTQRRLAARHAVILASIGDAVIACDTQSRITLLNPVAEKLTGFTSEEALGRPIGEVFRVLSAETRAPSSFPVAAVLATGEMHGRDRTSLLVRPDGTETPIADRAAPIVEDGVTIGVVLTFRDVTREVHARREIERQHRRLRSLNDAIPDLLFSVTQHGQVRFVKDTAHPDLLTSPDEAHALFVDKLFSPDIAAQIMAAVSAAIDAGTVQTVEYALDLPHGRQTFEARMARMSDDEVTVLVRNVTEDRALSEVLRSQRERLAQRTERQRGLLVLSADLARTTGRAAMLSKVRASLRTLLGVERLSLGERDAATGEYHLRMLDNPMESGRPNATTDDDDGSAAEPMSVVLDITGTSIAEALATGAPVTSRAHPPRAFGDWAIVQDALGFRHFVTIPLLGAAGAFGTLNVSISEDEPPSVEDIDWLAQLGAMIAAHLSELEARVALQALNMELEDRVASRTRELQVSEERFERLFQYAPRAMLIVDGAGQVAQSNHNAQRLFGYDESGFLGLPIAALVPAESREHQHGLMQSFAQAGLAGSGSIDRVVTAVGRDEREFTAEIGLVPLHLNGEPAVLAGLSDVSARVAAQAEVARSLHEKETLLQEIHHRVKNNLQIISSLLMLQANQMPSDLGRARLEESVHRVRSMALIHEQLYGAVSLERIDLGAYARQLAESLRGALAPSARINVNSSPTEVGVEVAVPLGLILNELLTNAFKYGIRSSAHAAQPGRTGPDCDILLEISSDGDTVRLAVTDSGPGLPSGFSAATPTTLGLQVVRSLCRQLRGKLTVSSADGTQFELTCPRRTKS